MKNNITVFVHHEIYDSSAKAYWLDCLIQAKKYNSDVVLCGSKIQEPMVDGICDFVDADTLLDERWIEFKKYFKNYTTSYSDNYQLSIHKRFFSLYQYMKIKGLDEIVFLDSDVLSYVNWSDILDFDDIDCACCVNENQYFTNYGDTEGLRWVANAGVSYWKIEALDEFIDFMIVQYRNPKNLLKKYEFHMQHNILGGVCEMSLIYLWLKTIPKNKFVNLAVARNGFVANSNYIGSYNYYDKEYQTDAFGNKKIKFIKGCQYPIYTLLDGTKIKGYNIHLAGSTKRFMHDIQVKNRFPLRYYIRGMLSQVKNKIKG